MSLAMLCTTQSALSVSTHLKHIIYGWRSRAQRPASKQAHDEQVRVIMNATDLYSWTTHSYSSLLLVQLGTTQCRPRSSHESVIDSVSKHHRAGIIEKFGLAGVKGTTALMVVSLVLSNRYRKKSHLSMASDTLNNHPVNLLSLDSGGIRGVSQLIILDEIMKCIQVKKHLTEVPKPCEYFHLIGGSGTGGLNAIMLGHLKMSTEDALHNYKKLAAAVFSPDNHKPFYKDGKFKASTLEIEIKEIVKNSCVEYTGDELLLDPDAGKGSIGNVFVCAKTSANLESSQ
ncbi:hypothetical protein IW262DRAFT_1558545 [Armillaria fumosa]|nr:hypothetical protein IW262DRAFT_1558545 [Armillaria fumosa]